MNLDVDINSLPPEWRIPVGLCALVLGLSLGSSGYLFLTKADKDDTLSAREFYEYMDEFKRDLKEDDQRFQDKLDEKVDKP